MLFKQYKANDVDKIYHPSIVNEWNANMEKEAYEERLHLGV